MNGDGLKETELRRKRIDDVGVANTIIEDVLITLGYQQPRRFDNVLQAIIYGWSPKSLDAVEVMRAHGAIQGVVMASDALGKKIKEEPEWARQVDQSEFNQILIEGFSTPYTGEWFYEDQIPTGWISLAKYGNEYTKRVGVISQIGGGRIKVFAVPAPLALVIELLIKMHKAL